MSSCAFATFYQRSKSVEESLSSLFVSSELASMWPVLLAEDEVEWAQPFAWKRGAPQARGMRSDI